MKASYRVPMTNHGSRFRRVLADQRAVLAIYAAAAIVVSIQRGVFGFPNDFAIFRASFWNLLAHRDLYVLRLEQAHDYFKYSPTFALLFAPFAVLPVLVGLFVWNLFNAVTIFFAIRLILPAEQWAPAQALVFLPMLRSMQSAQSNALVAAIIIVAFASYDRGFLLRGGLAIAVGAVIKIFPLAAVTFALPGRKRTSAVAIAALCTLVFILLPLAVTSPRGLLLQYQSWGALERSEATLAGSSVIELLRDLGLAWPAWPIQILGGAIVLFILVLRARDWEDRAVRLRFLGFVLLFCVVFNHRAERQSAVIAMAGMVIWFLTVNRSVWRSALFVVVYCLVAVSGSDVVPDPIKHALASTVRFSIPLTILWLVMLGELLLPQPERVVAGEAR
jgi:glycosyl transferase family 87